MVVWSFLLGLFLGLGLWAACRYSFYCQFSQMLRGYHARPLKSSLINRVQTVLKSLQQSLDQKADEIQSWQKIVNLNPVAYLQVDQDNLLLWCNQEARSLLGIQYPPGRLLLELVRSYELDCLIEEVRTLQQCCQREWLHTCVYSGEHSYRKPLRANGLPLPGGQVGIFLEDREEVRVLRDERDRWAADVAHELKTPLTSLRLVAETLQNRIDPSLRHWVDRLVNETIRLSLLVQELLELNRLSLTAMGEIQRQSLDVVYLIQTAWQSLEPLATAKQIHLNYDGPPSVIYSGNEAQLFRLLLNVFDNGIKYSPEQGVLQVHLRLTPRDGMGFDGFTGVDEFDGVAGGVDEVDGGVARDVVREVVREIDGNAISFLCLEIIDSGPGFHAKDIPYIFDRFYRADQARVHRPLQMISSVAIAPDTQEETTPIGSGSGLGLSIVRQIAECHGGYIQAANHPERGGAWLRIFLPMPPL